MDSRPPAISISRQERGEKPFLDYTTRLAETLKRAGVQSEFRLRVGGHDEAIWRDELAALWSRPSAQNERITFTCQSS